MYMATCQIVLLKTDEQRRRKPKVWLSCPEASANLARANIQSCSGWRMNVDVCVKPKKLLTSVRKKCSNVGSSKQFHSLPKCQTDQFNRKLKDMRIWRAFLTDLSHSIFICPHINREP